jgi:two-component system, NtrC family, response regulator AtoC
MDKNKSSILIVDDDELLNQTFNRALKQIGYDVHSCLKGEEALSRIQEISPDLILLDIYLGNVNGIHILEDIRKQGIQIPVIIITAYSDIELAVKAVKLGAEDFVVKPIDIDHLELIVARSLNNQLLKKEVISLKEIIKTQDETNYGKIIGKSKSFIATLEIAKSFAKSGDTTVLIEGESGTGKELVARLIHSNSSRSEGPFISINCGAIPKDIAESEFFGYERGAFTGASDKTRQGKFEIAIGGTILLDEIGDLNTDMQVKLLRVLQEKKYYRLGGSKEVTVDVRIIAATNRDLKTEVESGRFREDLYFRLNVASLKVPPLRERKEDIPLLINSFIDEFNHKFGKNFKGCEDEALKSLMGLKWKGNIRELRNVIERVMLIESDILIRRSYLNFVDLNVIKIEHESDFDLKIPQGGVSIDKVIKSLILQTLEITEGNQMEAARILGLTRSKLRYRMQQLGIESHPKTYY